MPAPGQTDRQTDIRFSTSMLKANAPSIPCGAIHIYIYIYINMFVSTSSASALHVLKMSETIRSCSLETLIQIFDLKTIDFFPYPSGCPLLPGGG